MRLPAIGHRVAVLCLLLASSAANAAVLTLPVPPPHERPLADNNKAPAIDLSPSCASDPRCQLQAGQPAEPAPGPAAEPPIAPAPTIDISQFSPSFTAGSTGDTAFQTLSGSPLKAYPAIASFGDGAPGQLTDSPTFAWQFSQGVMQTVTNVRALMALPEEWQANFLQADIAMPGRCQDAGMAGIHPECAAGGFEPVMRSLCVASDGSYNTIGASAQRDCPPGSVYVSSKRSAGSAEYAAYVQSLTSYVKDAANFHRLQSVDTRFPRQEGPARQSWHCSDCIVVADGEPAPGLLRRVINWLKDPVVIVLLGLWIVAALVADALLRARRA